MEKAILELLANYDTELTQLLSEREAYINRMGAIDVRMTQVIGAKEALERLIASTKDQETGLKVAPESPIS